MTDFATMQGRLTAPENSAIQAFPRNSWRAEFPLAAQAGLAAIEWIHDAYGETANPILTANGQDQICALAAEHGVAVRSLCADWFMDFPLVRCVGAERDRRVAHLVWLMGETVKVGVSRMVLPFVDASAMRDTTDQTQVREILLSVAPEARDVGMELHLETDLAPAAFAAFLDGLPEDVIKVNFDSGNSSGLGYPPAEEFAAWGPRLGSVHIKDRVLGGTTIALGQGSCDFPAVFSGLAKLEYDGDIVLQVARGEPGDEVALARHNRAFIEAGLLGAR